MEVINRERAVFLKSLSVEPETHVVDLADRLGITRDKAWSFVKNFLRTLSEEYDINNPQKIKDWVNLYVEPELQLSDYDITNLVPLLEKYPDPSYNYKKTSELNYTSDMTSNSNNNNLPPPLPPSSAQPNADDLNKIPGQPGQQKYDEFGQPERTVADWGQYNVSSLNRTVDLSFLPELTRIGLVRFVLQRVAQPPPNPRVEAFVQNFYLNEDQYMASPDTLRREFRDFFGEKTGEQAAHLFVSFIQNLPPVEHFGVRKQDRMNGMGNNGTAIPMGGGAYNPASPFTAGSQFENPFDTYYHREGVLGYGQDIRSYSAQRAIHEFELQRKRDKEMERRQEKMMSDARSSMQMQMFDFMRQLRAGGANGGGMGMGGGTGMDAMFWPMMMTAMSNGRLMMEPYTDAEGKTSMRMISNPVGAMAGQAADPDRVTLRDMIELMNNFNGRIDSKATENQALRDSILQDLRNQIGTTKQMPEQLLEYKKLFQELSPQNQGPWGNANPLDIARVMLEKEKIVGDRQMAEKAIERAANEKKDNQTMEVEKMKEANKTKNVLIKSMTGLLGSTAPMMLNLLLMLTGRQQLGGGVSIPGQAGGGGGLGGLMNMVQGLLGGLGGMGGAGGEEGEEGTGLGGNGGPGNGGMGGGMGGIFDALGGLFGTKQPQQPQQQNMGGGMNMGGMMPPSQQQDNGGGMGGMGGESYDVNDIMSGIQQMFGIGGNGGQQQQQQAPIPQTGGMPFMGFGAVGPDMSQQFTAPAAAYNRQPVSGGFGMPANAFEEAQTTAVTEPIFKINTNLPPYQQQYQQSQPQQRPQVIVQPPQVQVQPQQQEQEQATVTQNEYKIFTEADFANTPKEKLVEYENEARRSFDETQSYLKSIRNVINSSQ